MKVAVVDCGSGNLRSVTRALQRAAFEAGIAVEVAITRSPDAVLAADRLVLPGQGAFAGCLAGLAEVPGLQQTLVEAVRDKGRPFLGICVGMQLMADIGEEHGEYPGFGWIPGRVVPLRPTDRLMKVPHMGWNELTIEEPTHPVLANLPSHSHVYFANSYHLLCGCQADLLATSDFAGPVTAVAGRNNMIGTQFHPEKSQAVGLAVLQHYLRWRP